MRIILYIHWKLRCYSSNTPMIFLATNVTKKLDHNKPLPEGYKHKKCESCRNAQVQGVKNGLKAAVGVVGAVASFAIVIVTKGKVNPKK